MTFSKKVTPLYPLHALHSTHSTHSTPPTPPTPLTYSEYSSRRFPLLLSTAFLQKASGPGKNMDYESRNYKQLTKFYALETYSNSKVYVWAPL